MYVVLVLFLRKLIFNFNFNFHFACIPIAFYFLFWEHGTNDSQNHSKFCYFKKLLLRITVWEETFWMNIHLYIWQNHLTFSFGSLGSRLYHKKGEKRKILRRCESRPIETSHSDCLIIWNIHIVCQLHCCLSGNPWLGSLRNGEFKKIVTSERRLPQKRVTLNWNLRLLRMVIITEIQEA